MEKVNLETWVHRDTYKTFNERDLPFYSVTSQVNITRILEKSERDKVSFFALCLHEILKATNFIEAFRYRNLEDGTPVLHSKVNGSYLLEHPDGALSAVTVLYADDFQTFFDSMAQSKKQVLAAEHVYMGPNNLRDVVYVSCTPWMTFTGGSHPCDMGRKYDSIPRINIGKYTKHSDGSVTMPVNVHAHHGFVYGRHIAEFFAYLESTSSTKNF